MKGLVPVEYFRGTLKDAETTALRLNVKNRLPMTREAKTEAAWRMLVDSRKDPAWHRSWSQIISGTYVSNSSIKRMAKVLKERGDEVVDKTWSDVLREARKQQQDEMDGAARANWKEEKARTLADYLLKGPNLIQDPEVAAVQECVPDKVAVVTDALNGLTNPYFGSRLPPIIDVTDFPDTAEADGDFESL